VAWSRLNTSRSIKGGKVEGKGTNAPRKTLWIKRKGWDSRPQKRPLVGKVILKKTKGGGGNGKRKFNAKCTTPWKKGKRKSGG